MEGMGVLDPMLFGRALQMGWLWLQRAKADHCWSAFSINVDDVTRAFFKTSTRWQVGDGFTILFWSDNWLDGLDIRDIAPDLAAAVSRRALKSQHLALALTNHDWITDITGALSVLVLVQYLELRQQLDGVSLQTGV
jgi:hypothetical protein